jgi:methionine biosynthesis protein MetW
MNKNSVKDFENARWRGGDQPLVFRHVQALQMTEKDRNILDVGCGDGLLLEALSKKGISVSGIDISEEGAKKCREKGFDVSVIDAATERLPCSDGSFDSVIMLDILEHVYSPEVLIKEAIRVSKRRIIIGVPNFSSFPARFQVLFGKVPENNLPNKGHVYWFNHSVLMKLLKKNDLQMEKLSCNTFWENKPLVGGIMKKLCAFFPNLFALSFVVKASKK